MPVVTPTELQSSPLQNLTQRFSEQNQLTEDIIARLAHRLNNMSQNEPKNDDLKGAEPPSVTPFNEGLLMNYYYQLNRQSFNNGQLLDLITKLESLV